MHVLLLHPWYAYESVATYEEPIGVLYLATALEKAGHEVDVVDLTTVGRRLDAALEEKVRRAGLVGISATTPLFGAAIELLRFVKRLRPELPCVTGGAHASAAPTDCLKAGFDVAVIGEGEDTLIDLAETLEQRRDLHDVQGIAFYEGDRLVRNPARPFQKDLDAFPIPDRRFIDYSHYRKVGIISMRGCPYHCLFCKPLEDEMFGKKLRRRSLENVVEEIRFLRHTLGDRLVNFKDDTLTVHNAKWFNGLAQEMACLDISLTWQCSSRVDQVDREKLQAMYDSGCRQIFFGVESGSQRILDYYRKGIKVAQTEAAFALCHELGIRPCASFMLGASTETREDLELTYQLVKKIKPYNWHVHVTTPIVGTHLFNEAIDEKRIGTEIDYSSNSPTANIYKLDLPMKIDGLTPSDLAEYRDKINRYMKTRVILRSMASARMWKEILFSKGMRTIAYGFIRRHFSVKREVRRLMGRSISVDSVDGTVAEDGTCVAYVPSSQTPRKE
jgi:anaerobic magnesium-protoporphyrin IX monomethyl ester cyclase